MYNKGRTIFAAATTIGESSISVIRISGNMAFEIAGRIFSKIREPRRPEDISKLLSHTIHHGFIYDGEEFLDEVVLSIFKSPNSYTGEDVIEISTHGGSFVFRKISNLLIKQGATYAEPGEFSKRAFLNGKVDLIQAEAIADLIRAKTELATKSALLQLKGELSFQINDLKKELLDYCSLIELELDFSEEGIELVKKEELLERLEKIIQRIRKITVSYDSGRIIRDGINLAIIGNPNVGKSTIFNYLLKESRAIVSEIPGTTRDYLEEPLIIGGMVFNLIDTAGIHSASNAIEKEGIKRSFKKIEEADIILNVLDLSNDSANTNVNISENGKTLKVYNKLDIAKFIPENEICISAKTGQNVELLKSYILNKADSLIHKEDISEIYITNKRHQNQMLKSCEYLVNAKNLILDGKGNEIVAIEINEAVNSLGEIMGNISNFDVLNNIFAKFCIGK